MNQSISSETDSFKLYNENQAVDIVVIVFSVISDTFEIWSQIVNTPDTFLVNWLPGLSGYVLVSGLPGQNQTVLGYSKETLMVPLAVE